MVRKLFNLDDLKEEFLLRSKLEQIRDRYYIDEYKRQVNNRNRIAGRRTEAYYAKLLKGRRGRFGAKEADLIIGNNLYLEIKTIISNDNVSPIIFVEDDKEKGFWITDDIILVDYTIGLDIINECKNNILSTNIFIKYLGNIINTKGILKSYLSFVKKGLEQMKKYIPDNIGKQICLGLIIHWYNRKYKNDNIFFKIV